MQWKIYDEVDVYIIVHPRIVLSELIALDPQNTLFSDWEKINDLKERLKQLDFLRRGERFFLSNFTHELLSIIVICIQGMSTPVEGAYLKIIEHFLTPPVLAAYVLDCNFVGKHLMLDTMGDNIAQVPELNNYVELRHRFINFFRLKLGRE